MSRHDLVVAPLVPAQHRGPERIVAELHEARHRWRETQQHKGPAAAG